MVGVPVFLVISYKDRMMLNRFIAGGYVLLSPADRPSWMDASLVPPIVVSASGCICKTVPDIWAYDGADDQSLRSRVEAAGSLGVPKDVFRKVVKWCNAAFFKKLIAWPHVFVTVDTAYEFVHKFVRGETGLRIVGLGIHKDHAREFLDEALETDPSEVNLAYILRQDRGLADGGHVLGFEVLGFDRNDFHSWLCNGLEGEVAAALGVKPGPHGPIVSEHAAESVAKYCNREDLETEPVYWHPWALLNYSFE
jgi:hypothetical protein